MINNEELTNDYPQRYHAPIKVRVELRERQYIGFNRWLCTIHGEQREVTMQAVQWYCMDVESAVHSFNPTEIKSFTIIGEFADN